MTIKETKIGFVGDISLNGMYDELLPGKGPKFPFERIKGEFDEADLAAGNLESPFVQDGNPPEFLTKTPLKADPGYVEGLKWAGFNLLNLSNNHILDYGEQGAVATQQILEEKGIAHFGYGNDLESASRLKVISAGSLKIGFAGYTDVVIDSPFYAGQGSRGIAKFDIHSVKEETVLNKKRVDFLVINLHWGIEYFHLPGPEQISNARKLIDAGADIIIGHHPHRLQGIEKYGKGLIAYSLGNFIFSDIDWHWKTDQGENRTTRYKFSRACREGAILKVILNKNQGLGYEIDGTYVARSGQVFPKNKRVVKKIGYLSNLLKREDYSKYFDKELRKFQRRNLISHTLARFKKAYKIRPGHFHEFKELLRKWAQ